MPENTEKSVKDTEKSVNVAEKPVKADKAAKGEKSEKKDNAFVRFFKNTAKFLRDVKSEIKKIVWPAPKSVFKNTGVVLVTIIIIGLFIFGLDTAFMNLLGLIMNIAK